MNKIAIVTGANSGIGKEIAKKLVANNIYTILACRNEKQGKEIEKHLGEKSKFCSTENDPKLLRIVNTANIACGYHGVFVLLLLLGELQVVCLLADRGHGVARHAHLVGKLGCLAALPPAAV